MRRRKEALDVFFISFSDYIMGNGFASITAIFGAFSRHENEDTFV